MSKNPDILFFAAVHGDEGFTVPVLEGLTQEFPSKFHWLIANEVALKREVRFVDTDLNRSAPGDSNSSKYEMRRASELIKIAKQYRFVIDLHGTAANSGIFVLVSNPTPCNIALAASLPIANVVIWVAKSSEKIGPLAQFIDCSVGIECGPKSSQSVAEELRKIIRKILANGLNTNPSNAQNWFRVYGKIPKGEILAENLQDFKPAVLNGETFYPLLVGQYDDVVCYKMERINFWNLFVY